jgi:hypothetical protein
MMADITNPPPILRTVQEAPYMDLDMAVRLCAGDIEGMIDKACRCFQPSRLNPRVNELRRKAVNDLLQLLLVFDEDRAREQFWAHAIDVDEGTREAFCRALGPEFDIAIGTPVDDGSDEFDDEPATIVIVRKREER